MKNCLFLFVFAAIFSSLQAQPYAYVQNGTNCTLGYQLELLDINCNTVGSTSGSVNNCSNLTIDLGTIFSTAVFNSHRLRYRINASAYSQWRYSENACGSDACLVSFNIRCGLTWTSIQNNNTTYRIYAGNCGASGC